MVDTTKKATKFVIIVSLIIAFILLILSQFDKARLSLYLSISGLIIIVVVLVLVIRNNLKKKNKEMTFEDIVNYLTPYVNRLIKEGYEHTEILEMFLEKGWNKETVIAALKIITEENKK